MEQEQKILVDGQKLNVHFQSDDRLVLGAGRYGSLRRGGHIQRL